MLQRILQFFDTSTAPEDEVDSQERVRVATCALLVELAQADEDFKDIEKNRIVEILCDHYGLSIDHAGELVALAQEELQDSVHLWRFTRLINEHYSVDEKLKVIEMAWRVIYADGKLDRYEDHLVHRLAKLLNLTHRQLIDAKVRVLEESRSD